MGHIFFKDVVDDLCLVWIATGVNIFWEPLVFAACKAKRISIGQKEGAPALNPGIGRGDSDLPISCPVPRCLLLERC